MKTFKGFLTTATILCIVAALFFYREAATNALWGARGMLEGVLGSGYNFKSWNALKTENESLRAQLEGQQFARAAAADTLLEAQVYSHYPFNDKNALMIDKGAGDGVKVGMPVLAARGVLLGRVSAVKERVSEVITIFDPAWKSSAVVGDGVKAVLQGANDPRLELIPKASAIKEGDDIRNISPEYPMGLHVGVVGSAHLDEKKVWQVADITIAYNVEDLASVYVVTNFP